MPEQTKGSPRVQVQIRGGLGNQLFCYAFGRGLAVQHGYDVSYDAATGYFGDIYVRKFVLDVAGVRGRFEYPSSSAFRFILRAAARCAPNRPWFGRAVVLEPTGRSFVPVPDYSRAKSIYCIGYWQSPRYFDGAEAEVRDDFAHVLQKWHEEEEYPEVPEIAIGVRSYNEVKHRDYHIRLGREYYRTAIHLARERHPNGRMVVYADRNSYAAEILAGLGEFAFEAEVEATEDVLRKFAKMSRSKAFIIANSSYDWWAAWLADAKRDRLICAPNDAFPNRDILPPHWVRL
jgi:hypothetical protein